MRASTLIVAGIVLCTAWDVSAVPIPVANDSFEVPVLGPPPGHYAPGVVPSWTVVGGGGTGVLRPNPSPVIAPDDGLQVVTMHAAGGAVSQAPTILAAETAYTLTVAMGQRDDGVLFGGYRIRLYAGSTAGTVLAEDLDLVVPPEGLMVDRVLSYTTGDSGPELGLPLVIELLNSGSTGTGQPVEFDNVRLDAESVAIPEPSSLVIWTMGVIGILAIARRRRGEA